MFKKSLLLSSLVFSLFFISSCHYLGKKSCSGEKWSQDKKGKKCSKKKWGKDWKKGKKACCKKKWGKHKRWNKRGKKACCGKADVAGQVDLMDLRGSRIKGEVFFEQVGRYQVKVTAKVKGLKANQKFGFHVHEYGNCKNKALMAGAHFNPWGEEHAGPHDKKRHMGDLGNLVSNAKGQAEYSAVVPAKLRKFLGRSVIVHSQADDFKSQPTGKSGNRIACGVVSAAMPPAPPVEEKKDESSAGAKASTEKASAEQKASVKKAPAVQKVKTPAVKKDSAVQKVKTPAVKKAPEVKKASDKKASPVQKVKTPEAPVKKTPAVQKASTKKAPATQKTSTKKTTEVKKATTEKKKY